MLRNLKPCIGNPVIAEDGHVGTVKDLSVRVQDWRIDGVAVRLPWWSWFRTVRIDGTALRRPVGFTGMLPVALKRKQVEHCQSAEGDNDSAKGLADDLLLAGIPVLDRKPPQIVSCSSLLGYDAKALDGVCGTLVDLIVDDEQWFIRYLVVALSIEGINHHTLVPTAWIYEVEQEGGSVALNLVLAEIAGSPDYNPEVPINRDIEVTLYSYYGQPLKGPQN